MRIDALCILRPFMVFLACIFAEVLSQQLNCQSASMGNFPAWQVRWRSVKPIDFMENPSTDDSEKELVGLIEFPTLNFHKNVGLFAVSCCICVWNLPILGWLMIGATEHPPGTEHCSFHGAASSAAWALCAAWFPGDLCWRHRGSTGTSTGGS